MYRNIINLIKLSNKYNKQKFKTKLNKNDIKFIKILIKINLIKYVKKKNNIYDIYIYNTNKKIFKNILNIHKPSKTIFLNFKNLKKITFFYNGILILSTNKGLMTNYEAVKEKIGGILILKLWN
jgi:small subunit ribosomal protein S8